MVRHAWSLHVCDVIWHGAARASDQDKQLAGFRQLVFSMHATRALQAFTSVLL